MPDNYDHRQPGDYTAMLTTGERYTGNQQFKGTGLTRWCALCGTHKSQLGGTLRSLFGGRHWVCVKHPKVVK
jgi:hypothetical protein